MNSYWPKNKIKRSKTEKIVELMSYNKKIVPIVNLSQNLKIRYKAYKMNIVIYLVELLLK